MKTEQGHLSLFKGKLQIMQELNVDLNETSAAKGHWRPAQNMAQQKGKFKGYSWDEVQFF